MWSPARRGSAGLWGKAVRRAGGRTLIQGGSRGERPRWEQITRKPLADLGEGCTMKMDRGEMPSGHRAEFWGASSSGPGAVDRPGRVRPRRQAVGRDFRFPETTRPENRATGCPIGARFAHGSFRSVEIAPGGPRTGQDRSCGSQNRAGAVGRLVNRTQSIWDSSIRLGPDRG